jgi:acyl-CoA thioester hydrolase
MKIRVYYEDTDCANVVYYANYLKYMERSRTEFMREKGVDLVLYQKQGYHFAIVDAHIKYRASAKYNDLLDVETIMLENSSATILFCTTIRNESGQLLVKGEVKAAFVTPKGNAGRIPVEVIEALRGNNGKLKMNN